MATESSTPPLFFPAFLFGERTTCHRKMKAEAKKWAKRYEEGGDFPEPKLIPVPPESIMYPNEGASRFLGDGFSFSDDLTSAEISDNPKEGAHHLQWRLYLVENLRSETVLSFDTDRGAFDRCKKSIEPYLCRYPWGAVSVAITHNLFNTIPVVTRRVEALLSFWEQLDTLRYLNRHKPVSFTAFMAYAFQSEIAMWVDQPTGNIRTDLRTAIDQMRRASDDEIRGRLMRRLHEIADTRPGLNHREWLKTPGVIERELESYASEGREWFDNLTTGNIGCLGGFLAILDRKYPDGYVTTT